LKLSKNTVIIALVILLIGLWIYQVIQSKASFPSNKPAVGDMASNFSLPSQSGNMVSLSDYKDKVVLVNFWASWCPPCKAEMPGFQRVYSSFGAKGFEVIGIAIDDVPPALISEMKITYPIARGNSKVSREYGDIMGVPVSFLIGRDGRIRKKVKGVYSEEDLMRDVENALSKQTIAAE
jgi:peroxiredoxin